MRIAKVIVALVAIVLLVVAIKGEIASTHAAESSSVQALSCAGQQSAYPNRSGYQPGC